jgi:hypothetical protein
MCGPQGFTFLILILSHLTFENLGGCGSALFWRELALATLESILHWREFSQGSDCSVSEHAPCVLRRLGGGGTGGDGALWAAVHTAGGVGLLLRGPPRPQQSVGGSGSHRALPAGPPGYHSYGAHYKTSSLYMYIHT